MAIGYWGYPNGDIPTGAMAPVHSRGGTFWLEPSAQFWWLQLAAEYQRAWGVPLDITDGYRDLAEQWYYWNAYQAGWGNVAAYPGKSNHGWAMAVDIYTPSFGGSTSTLKHEWLRRWAPGYGWTWTTGKASGESWHWEFTNVPTVPASDGSTSIGEWLDMVSEAQFNTAIDRLRREERARLYECSEHIGEYLMVDWDLPSTDPAKLAFPKSAGQIGSLENNYQYGADDEIQAKILSHTQLETVIKIARGVDDVFDPTPRFAQFIESLPA